MLIVYDNTMDKATTEVLEYNEAQNPPDALTVSNFVYEFSKLEDIPPNPDDVISIGAITESDVEFSALVDAGVSPDLIGSGKLKRADLLKAGFVFNNHPLGRNMEKPLLKGIVDGINLEKRKLLTQDELNMVLLFQKEQQDDFIPEWVDVSDLRQDMFMFLLSGEDPRTSDLSRPLNAVRLAIDRITRNINGKSNAQSAETDKQLFDLYWEEYKKTYTDLDEAGNYMYPEVSFLNEFCSDV